MQKTTPSSRIEVLDYLRGFFILVIIIDHLWRWPNLFQYISGRGELWVSAAEGFVMISGLLVGYVRGRKGLKRTFGEISRKLVERGVMLYAWVVITSIILVIISWILPFKSSIAYVPFAMFDWGTLMYTVITLGYVHTLTHFLYLYAIFLALSPLLVWLLRRNLWWVGVVASVIVWWIGYVKNIEWLQWQILFYLPATAGFYLDQILAYYRRIPKTVVWGFMTLALGSIVASAWIILAYTPGTYIYSQPEIFSREPLAIGRILLSFVWLLAIGWLFTKLLPQVKQWFGWLLLPFGMNSLTTYIVHGLPLMLISWLLPPTDSFIINTLLAVFAIMATWAIIKIPGINRVIPR